MNLSNVMVVNFSTGERTAELSQLCFKKLGFNNIILLEGQDGFVDKFFRFAEIGLQSNCSIFIRSDADRLVFDGILDLLEKFTDTETDCAEGTGFEFFMNRYRGATPHIFSRKILELLLSRPELMPNIQKPEQNFLNNAVNTGNIIEKTYKVLTNLHEFEQYPSKVCNSSVCFAKSVRYGYSWMSILHCQSKCFTSSSPSTVKAKDKYETKG